MSMRKIAIATGIGLMMTAGATGRSDHPEQAKADDAGQLSFEQQLRLSPAQIRGLQAKFRYWRASDSGYTELKPPL